MKHFATIALVLGFLPVTAADRTSAQSQVSRFQDLFNGRDLTGWVNINTAVDTWKYRDGMLICFPDALSASCAARTVENFVLHIEWMHMEAGGNSTCGATPGPMSAAACPTASKYRCWSSNGRT